MPGAGSPKGSRTRPSGSSSSGLGGSSKLLHSSEREDAYMARTEEATSATRHGQTKKLGALLKRFPELATDRSGTCGRTLLHEAASRGQVEAVELLLTAGAKVEARELESGWTALHCALYTHHLRVAVQLLTHRRNGAGELLNGGRAEDKEGFTPLDLLSIVHRRTANTGRNTARRGGVSVATRGAAVEAGGDCLCWGSGANYQLGNGANTDVSLPRRPAALRGYTVVQVSTSVRHTLFLVDDGKVFAAGHGPGGRIGTGNEHTQPNPVAVAKLRDVRFVAAGPNGSAAITKDGQLFAWGRSPLGICTGSDDVKNASAVLAPRRVQSMREHSVAQVCLEANYLAVVTSKGALFMAGGNIDGQLCSESRGVEPRTEACMRRVSALADQRLRSIACAPKGCVALLEADVDYVYEWGWGGAMPRRVCLQSRRAKAEAGRFHRSHKLSISSVSVGTAVLVASSAGEVFSWLPGGGEVQKLRLFREKRIVDVAACEGQNMLRTDFGDLYTYKVDVLAAQAKRATPGVHRTTVATELSPSQISPRTQGSPGQHGSPGGHGISQGAVVPSTPRPPHLSARPKLSRAIHLKQVTAFANGGTHFHAISAPRAMVGLDTLSTTSNHQGSKAGTILSLSQMCQRVAAENLTLESLLPTYAFALGYEAHDLAEVCAEAINNNLEMLLLGVADGTAVPAEIEDCLLDLFEAAEMHGEDICTEVSECKDTSTVVHGKEIKDLQEQIEQASADYEFLSAMAEGGAEDIQPEELAQSDQALKAMFEQLEALQAASVRGNISSRPSFRHKIHPSVCKVADVEQDGSAFDADQLRKRLRAVRKKLTAVGVLEHKQMAGQTLVLQQLKKLDSRNELLEEEAELLFEASMHGLDVENIGMQHLPNGRLQDMPAAATGPDEVMLHTAADRALIASDAMLSQQLDTVGPSGGQRGSAAQLYDERVAVQESRGQSSSRTALSWMQQRRQDRHDENKSARDARSTASTRRNTEEEELEAAIQASLKTAGAKAAMQPSNTAWTKGSVETASTAKDNRLESTSQPSLGRPSLRDIQHAQQQQPVLHPTTPSALHVPGPVFLPKPNDEAANANSGWMPLKRTRSGTKYAPKSAAASPPLTPASEKIVSIDATSPLVSGCAEPRERVDADGQTVLAQAEQTLTLGELLETSRQSGGRSNGSNHERASNPACGQRQAWGVLVGKSPAGASGGSTSAKLTLEALNAKRAAKATPRRQSSTFAAIQNEQVKCRVNPGMSLGWAAVASNGPVPSAHKGTTFAGFDGNTSVWGCRHEEPDIKPAMAAPPSEVGSTMVQKQAPACDEPDESNLFWDSKPTLSSPGEQVEQAAHLEAGAPSKTKTKRSKAKGAKCERSRDSAPASSTRASSGARSAPGGNRNNRSCGKVKEAQHIVATEGDVVATALPVQRSPEDASRTSAAARGRKKSHGDSRGRAAGRGRGQGRRGRGGRQGAGRSRGRNNKPSGTNNNPTHSPVKMSAAAAPFVPAVSAT